jgi:hypothetical protein
MEVSRVGPRTMRGSNATGRGSPGPPRPVRERAACACAWAVASDVDADVIVVVGFGRAVVNDEDVVEKVGQPIPEVEAEVLLGLVGIGIVADRIGRPRFPDIFPCYCSWTDMYPRACDVCSSIQVRGKRVNESELAEGRDQTSGRSDA